MRRPAARPKPRKTTLASFPVPTAGLISNRNIALPTDQGSPPGAAVLNNWFPSPSTVTMRRGMVRHATLEGGAIRSLFTYVIGQQENLFAATDIGIWDVSEPLNVHGWAIADDNDDYISDDDDRPIGEGELAGGEVLTGTTNGDWSVVQFSTAGGTYLIGVNGVDTGFIYDGDAFWPYVAGGVSEMAVTLTDDFVPGETVSTEAKVQYAIDDLAGTFVVGETITGGTSAATAEIASIDGDDLVLIDATGAFTLGETITGGTSAATAEIDSAGEDATGTATVHRVDAGMLFLVSISGVFAAGDAILGDEEGAGVVVSAPMQIVPGMTGIDSSRLSYVWAYKTRLWFIERNSLSAWYLPVDQVGGELTEFPLGGVFNRGGSLLWGQTWSLDSGGEGGLSEQNVFTTTEGEVAAYQGISPDDAQTWGKVGVYRIGRPMGKKAFIRAGGDLVVATSIGFIPLGQAIQRDYAALGLIAISNPIADEWRRAVVERGMENWQCELWGEGSMVVVSPPTPDSMSPVVFVANSDSGAWARFTGWHPLALEVFRGRLFMGSILGRVQEAWVGGRDEGAPYTADMIPLFNDLGGPGQRKFAEFARVVKRGSYLTDEVVAARFDWDMSMPPAPDAPNIGVGNEWDNATWDQSIWNAERQSAISEKWRSVGGSGYAVSVVVRETSGSPVPPDTEIVRIDFTYAQGDILS